jgi:hypothetical protein
MIFWLYEYILVTLLTWLIPTLTARNTYTLRRALIQPYPNTSKSTIVQTVFRYLWLDKEVEYLAVFLFAKCSKYMSTREMLHQTLNKTLGWRAKRQVANSLNKMSRHLGVIPRPPLLSIVRDRCSVCFLSNYLREKVENVSH